jgi:hypothetical protein
MNLAYPTSQSDRPFDIILKAAKGPKLTLAEILNVRFWHSTDMQAAWDNVFSAHESEPQFALHQNQPNEKVDVEFSHQYAHAREEFTP